MLIFAVFVFKQENNSFIITFKLKHDKHSNSLTEFLSLLTKTQVI